MRLFTARVFVAASALLIGCGDGTAPTPDVSGPILTITSPESGISVNTAVLQVSGTVSDTEGVARLSYQVNEGAEQQVPISPGTSMAFRASVPVSPGENRIVVAAYDRSGNRTAAPELVVTVDQASPQLAISSAGTTARPALLVTGTVADDRGIRRIGYRHEGSPEVFVPVVLAERAGTLSFEVPVAMGANTIAFVAYDAAGNASAPVRTTATRVGITSLSGGRAHMCALFGARAYCWGDNSSGQLGDGTQANRTVPTEVAGGHSFRQVGAGNSLSCGLSTEGALLCWGMSAMSAGPVPVPVGPGMTFQSLAVGPTFACALTAAGAAYCVGLNESGQLGDGTLSRRTSPVAVAGGHTFRALSAGEGHACGITTTRELLCWGRSQMNRSLVSAVPAATAAELRFADVAVGPSHSCGVTTDGLVYCWGSNSAAELGTGSSSNSTERLGPLRVPGLVDATAIAAGDRHNCAITRTGAYCWGSLTGGRISLWTAPNAHFESIGAGSLHACGIASNGLYCWGQRGEGTLGNGTTFGSHTPTPAVIPF